MYEIMQDIFRPLGAVSTIIMGTSPNGSTYNREGKGLPLLNGPTEFGPDHPDCSLFTTDPKRACEPGDLIFCVRGSTTGRMNWADKKYALGRGVCAIRGKTRNDTLFIRYALEANLTRLLQFAGGTTFPNLTKDALKSFLIPFPENRGQIVSILSAYDDLIENNRRRIKLLEQAARLIYKEWFVHLRFPGHEHVKIIDGVPEGWKRKALGEVVDIRKGQNITKEMAREGTVPVVAGGMNPAYYHDEANVRGPVITISASGANAGYVTLYYEDIWASDCSYISKESTALIYYIYLLLKERQKEVYGLQKGAAQPHVYPKDLMRLKIVLPPISLIRQFEETVKSSFELISTLTKQNKQLTQARDLLLPRLMNGVIKV